MGVRHLNAKPMLWLFTEDGTLQHLDAYAERPREHQSRLHIKYVDVMPPALSSLYVNV